MDAIECTDSNISFRDFFSHNGKSISSLADFWGWKSALIIDDLEEMLDELQNFTQTVRENNDVDQTQLAEEASDELKSFASSNGVDLATASTKDLAKLEQALRNKITELLKSNLVLSETDSQDDESTTDTDSAETETEEVSLAESDFQRDAMLEILDSFVGNDDTTDLGAYADSVQTDSDNTLALCA